MITKSISYKNMGQIKDVLQYLFQEHKKHNGFLHTKYIHGDKDLQSMVKQFEKADARKIIKRKNSTAFYHAIISLHPRETNIDVSILKKIALKYVSLRCPKSLSLSVYHDDQNHKHLHILHANTQFSSGKSCRISKEQFRDIKIAMSNFGQEIGLKHSKVNHVKKKLKAYLNTNIGYKKAVN